MREMAILLKEKFNEGLTFEEFLAASDSKGGAFRRNYNNSTVPDDLKEQIEDIVKKCGGLRFFVMTEAWCPDAVQNVPPLARMVDAVDDAQMRCYFREENPDLHDIFQDLGITKIPAIAVCDTDFRVNALWQERPAPAHEVVSKIKMARQKGEDTQKFSSQLHQGYQSEQFRRAMIEEIIKKMRKNLD